MCHYSRVVHGIAHQLPYVSHHREIDQVVSIPLFLAPRREITDSSFHWIPVGRLASRYTCKCAALLRAVYGAYGSERSLGTSLKDI